MAKRIDESDRQTYYGDGRQPWDDIVSGGFGGAFAAGSILKYLRRTKGERDKDVEKARWYWKRLLELSLKSGEDSALMALAWLGQSLDADERKLLTK